MLVTNITKHGDGRPMAANGVLKVTELTPERIEVEHFNEDDGFYWYKYEVVGTPREIAAITEFCNKLSAATAPGK